MVMLFNNIIFLLFLFLFGVILIIIGLILSHYGYKDLTLPFKCDICGVTYKTDKGFLWINPAGFCSKCAKNINETEFNGKTLGMKRQ
jgi:hypothetical protein